MADVELTKDERTALSVLAFLFFRMGMDDRARRVYEALAELSEPGTGDRRFAKAGVAAVAVESGDGEGALAALREAMAGGALSTKDASLYLLKARALWLLDRKTEAQSARDQFLYLTGQPEHNGEKS